MHSLITIILVLFFTFYLIHKTKNENNGKPIIIAYILKLSITVGVWYIYTFYFSNTSLNDIHKYFNDGYILNQSFRLSPSKTIEFIFYNKKSVDTSHLLNQLFFWTKPNQYGLLNDNQTIIIINFILCFFSGNSLLFQSIFIASFSFYTTFKLFITINKYVNLPKTPLFLILFFNSSYLIWTSGNFKETFLYIGLTLLLTNIIKLLSKDSSFKIHLLITSNLVFILFCKNYFFIFLIPGICSIYVAKYFFKKTTRLVTYSYTIFLLVIVLFGLFYHPVNFENQIKDPVQRKKFINKVNSISYTKNALGENRNVFEVLRFKQRDQQFEAKSQKAKTVIYSPTLDGNPRTFLKCIPFSIANTLFRPTFSDLKNPLFIPDIFITLVLWVLIFLTLFFRKKDISENEKILSQFLLYFTLLIFLVIGILVPVLGNIIRYRAPVIPLFALALMINIDFNKIQFWNKLYFWK
jgi:hypothetical protein